MRRLLNQLFGRQVRRPAAIEDAEILIDGNRIEVITSAPMTTALSRDRSPSRPSAVPWHS
jgi:hypothetical protein